MAAKYPEPRILRRIVRYKDSLYFPCTTDGKVQDGKMVIRIEKEHLTPIAHEFTVEKCGMAFESIQYLKAIVPAEDVLKPVFARKAYRRYDYPKNWRPGLRCPLPDKWLNPGMLVWIAEPFTVMRRLMFPRGYFGVEYLE